MALLAVSIVWGRWTLPKARRARADLLRRRQGRTVTVYVGAKSIVSETGRVVEVDEAANRLVLDTGSRRRSVLLSDVASVHDSFGNQIGD